jgi:hypothetical protein
MRSVSGIEPTTADDLQHVIERELRLMWNARGAADIARLEGEIATLFTSPEHIGVLTRALGTLDR